MLRIPLARGESCKQDFFLMIPGSKSQNSGASLLAEGVLTLVYEFYVNLNLRLCNGKIMKQYHVF